MSNIIYIGNNNNFGKSDFNEDSDNEYSVESDNFPEFSEEFKNNKIYVFDNLKNNSTSDSGNDSNSDSDNESNSDSSSDSSSDSDSESNSDSSSDSSSDSIDESNEKNKIKKIICTKFYSIDDAIKCKINSNQVFIIANERMTKNNKIGRYYTVFPCFKLFLKNREKFPHCHELIVDHINNKIDNMGRLVFDFDIKPEKNLTIPKNFKLCVETTIIDVVREYFKNVDIDCLDFVWSTSQNPNKFSKHLTVKNFYFSDWIKMSKIFYTYFCTEWDKNDYGIKSSKLVDLQIVKNRTSLRMVGSSKIGGYPLVFDKSDHELSDSLIRIYIDDLRKTEQKITFNNLVEKNIFTETHDIDNITTNKIEIKFNKSGIKKQPFYPQEIYKKAFDIINNINPSIFKPGKISGKILSLIREKSFKCLISGKIHENENAYLKIDNTDKKLYAVHFGCFRYCGEKKLIYVGFLQTTGSEIDFVLAPEFEKKDPKTGKTKLKPIKFD